MKGNLTWLQRCIRQPSFELRHGNHPSHRESLETLLPYGTDQEKLLVSLVYRIAAASARKADKS